MGVRIFKIALILVGFITFLHAVVVHDHHSEKIEIVCHDHHQDDFSFFKFLELAFHHSQSYGASDTFTVDENFNKKNLINQEPAILKWLREKELFVYYNKLYFRQPVHPQFVGFAEELRGPPSIIA